MQTTLLGFAIALILALLAALIGPHFVNWNDHRAFFEAEASRLVGLKVTVGGDIDAGILPFPSVTLNDIAIGADGDADRSRARSLRIELGLGPLMRGELRATEMKLVAPQFSVGLDNKGEIDWPPLALSSDTLSIDRLSIEDGRATLTDAASRSRLVLDQLWFTGSVSSLTGPIRGKGEFVAAGGLYGYEVSAGRSGPDGTRLKVSLRTDERPLTVEADGMLSFERAAPRFDGTLTLSRPAGAVLATGKAVAYEPWRLTSKIKTGASAAALDDVSFQYGPDERAVTLGGSAEFKFGDKPQLQGALTTRQLDLDRLLASADAPRRLPLAAVQAFGELLGSALRPTFPVKLSLNIDGMTLGGSAVQAVSTALQSDGAAWTLDKLEFRAPGFTQVKADGRLYPLGKGLGFSGGLSVDASDPKTLMAWLTGRSTDAAQYRPWHAKGDVTLGADRIAVERLRTQVDRDTVEGSVAYVWPNGGRPARLEADLRAADIDLDGVFGLGQSALSGLGLERPGEVTLALDIGHAKVGGVDARSIAARFKLDAGGLAIDRLSIADIGDMNLVATGHIQTLADPGGNVTLYLDARDLNGTAALADKWLPALAAPLRRLAARQKTAVLRASVSLGSAGTGGTSAKAELTGQLGAIRVNVSGSASGKREAFSITDPGALSGTDLQLKGQLESDDAGPLLALFRLDRLTTAGSRPARLDLAAQGPAGGDLRFDAKLDAGPIDVTGKGALKQTSGQPATVDLDQLSGTVGGSKVQGRLAVRLGDDARIDGSIEAETLDAPAVVAAAIGLPAKRAGEASGWSTEPFVWNAPAWSGRVEFKAQRATLLPSLASAQLQGVARFGASEVVFENIAGELAKGRLEGRLAIASGADGVSARVRVSLTDAAAATIFTGVERAPVSGRLAFQTEIEGAGRSPAAFIGSLAGFGAITLEQGELAGLNPDVFGAVTRAVELGIPTDGRRIRPFVAGVLDNASLPVSKASAAISISAGQARFSDIAIKASGADVQATASVDLSDATLDALLTLNGAAAAPNAARPAVLVALKGPLPSPNRTLDTSVLASWLTLRAVEQHSRQIDAIEQARSAGAAASPKPSEFAPASAPNATGGIPAGAQAPALPPPVNVPATPKPRAATGAGNAAAPRAIARPPGSIPNLVGAQN